MGGGGEISIVASRVKKPHAHGSLQYGKSFCLQGHLLARWLKWLFLPKLQPAFHSSALECSYAGVRKFYIPAKPHKGYVEQKISTEPPSTQWTHSQ